MPRMSQTRVFFIYMLLHRPIAFYCLDERRVKTIGAVLTMGSQLR